MDDRFLILDTETTGLLAPELITIAVVDHRGETVLSEAVRPAKPIEPEASRISGLTMESVADRPEFPAIAADVSRALTGRRVIIYNAAYDTQVLRNTSARYGLEVPQFRPWCAMEWFARLYGEWDDGRGTYRWQPLSKAAAYFGVAQDTAHNAVADCLTTWRILEEAFRRSGLRVPGMQPLF
ncbi:MAG: 3'-5' exonuclease [Candidatus Bipolaricaulis sp.]|nr:3'-5' exonuclease [Candidatus Bipolaricaulis sp.]